NDKDMAALGATKEARYAKIEDMFNRKTETLSMELAEKAKINNAKLWGVIARPLAAMQGRERETLRAAYHLYNIGAIGSYSFYVSRAALIYGDGKAQIPNGMSWDGLWQGPNMQVTDPTEAMKRFTGMTSESAISSVLHWLETSAAQQPNDPTIKMLKE